MAGSLKRAYKYYMDTFLLRWVVGPLIICGPSSLFVLARFNSPLEVFLRGHVYLTIVMAILPLSVLPATYIAHRMREELPLSERDLMLLLKTFDHIVASKSSRFQRAVDRLAGKKPFPQCAKDPEKPCGRELFLDITKPEEQIKLIMEGVWQYFFVCQHDANVEIKVALARMGNKHIEEFLCFYPSDKGPRSDVSELQKPRATFSQAKASGKLVIVESTLQEGKKSDSMKNKCYVSTAQTGDEDGSLLCFPVRDNASRAVPFVISVHASLPRYFKKAATDSYRIPLEKFANRIALEANLERIKENVQ
jgi:hypothetical protein